ncbi:MAG: T9SS type A sorting domain-containing protein [Bacteroidetes bacterium]|nr:T9SS type A sorting domain-containing protein [Bacteroidota bacterium]
MVLRHSGSGSERSSKHALHTGGNQLTFSLEHLAAGTYTAVVTSHNEVYSKKLVVTR